MVACLVDRTFEDHFGMAICYHCRGGIRYNGTQCVVCLDRGEIPKCHNKEICPHAESGNLAVARLVESGMTIGKKRARLDIPDEPETVKLLAQRLEGFANDDSELKKIGAVSVFKKTAEMARKWANRSPLERLAEAGLELD